MLPRPCCQPKSLCSAPFPPLHCIRHYLAHVGAVAARHRTRVNHWLLTTSCRPTDPSCEVIKRLAKFRDPKTSSATKRSLHLAISFAVSSHCLRRLPVQSLDYHTASSAARFNALKPLCRLARGVAVIAKPRPLALESLAPSSSQPQPATSTTLVNLCRPFHPSTFLLLCSLTITFDAEAVSPTTPLTPSCCSPSITYLLIQPDSLSLQPGSFLVSSSPSRL